MATSSFSVGQALGVLLAAFARIVGGEDELYFFKAEDPSVNVLLQVSERTQNDVVSLARQLELNRLLRAVDEFLVSALQQTPGGEVRPYRRSQK